jgi:hypothetical protein
MNLAINVVLINFLQQKDTRTCGVGEGCKMMYEKIFEKYCDVHGVGRLFTAVAMRRNN